MDNFREPGRPQQIESAPIDGLHRKQADEEVSYFPRSALVCSGIITTRKKTGTLSNQNRLSKL